MTMVDRLTAIAICVGSVQSQNLFRQPPPEKWVDEIEFNDNVRFCLLICSVVILLFEFLNMPGMLGGGEKLYLIDAIGIGGDAAFRAETGFHNQDVVMFVILCVLTMLYVLSGEPLDGSVLSEAEQREANFLETGRRETDSERGAREYRKNDPNRLMWPYVFTSGKPVMKKHWDRLYSGRRRRFGRSNPSDYTGDDINSVDGGPPSDAD